MTRREFVGLGNKIVGFEIEDVSSVSSRTGSGSINYRLRFYSGGHVFKEMFRRVMKVKCAKGQERIKELVDTMPE